jgi:hypothetical protein
MFEPRGGKYISVIPCLLALFLFLLMLKQGRENKVDVRHKCFEAITKDRPMGVGRARQTWQVQTSQPKKRRE